MLRTPGITYKELEDGSVGVELVYNDEPTVFSMEQLVAMMLAKLVNITLEATGSKPGDCVISIPGFYTDAQRQAMLNACDISQLHCLRLLHEGTATALEYGMFKSAKGVFDAEKPQHVVFVDLGHASLSVTVASYVTGKLTIRSAAYDRTLGGRDFDEVIARKVGAAFKAKHGADPWAADKPKMKLLAAGEKAKKTLSPFGVTEARIGVECLMNDTDFNLTLTLDEYVADCEPLLARMAAPLMQAVAQSGVAPQDIATVEIVGGSTRLGFVKKRMSDIFIGAGLPIDKTALNDGLMTTMNADEAVSRGTAWQAALLSTRFRVKEFKVEDAVSFPVKLVWEPAAGAAAAAAAPSAEDAELEDGAAEGDGAVSSSATSAVVFKKHEATPNAKKVTFRRAAAFSVAAAYDDAALPDLPPGTNPTIRTFRVEVPADLPLSEGGPPKIRVHVKHTLHGMVAVSSAQLMEEIKEAEAAPAKESEAAGGEAKDAKEGDAKDGSEEPPKKKRFKKVELAVTASEVGMSRARVELAIEHEVKMAHQDKVIEETNAAKNEVEAYVYAQRDDLVGDLKPFCTDAEKEDQEAALTAAEDWLYYGEGYENQKSAYVEKLKDLKKKGAAAGFRQAEARSRGTCVQALQASCAEYKAWLVASETDGAFAHVTEDEKASVRAACAAAEEWLFSGLEAQAKLADNVDPSLTTEDLAAKRRSLVEACKKVVNKPKPKPPKAEAKPAEPAAAEGDPGAAAEEGKEEGKDAGAEGKEGDAPEGKEGAAEGDAAPAEGDAAPAEAKEGDAPAAAMEEDAK
jgi:heat shock protein 4